MNDSPLFRKTDAELEQMFQLHYADEQFRHELRKALRARKTPRAGKLLVRLQTYEKARKPQSSNELNNNEIIANEIQTGNLFEKITVTSPDSITNVPEESPDEMTFAEPGHITEPQPRQPFIPPQDSTVEEQMANELKIHSGSGEEAILNSWIAIEVLSPATFLQPEKLAGGNRHQVPRFKNGLLPWECDYKCFQKGCATYYQIILGTIQMEPAISKLLQVYSDSRHQRPQAKGEAIIATLLVDKNGVLIENDAISLSSFAWGLPVALAGHLNSLALWASAERILTKQLREILYKQDENGVVIPAPLTIHDVKMAFRWVVQKLGIPDELTNPPLFCVATFKSYREQGNPETILLNSFFLRDLSLVKEHAQENKLPEILRRYLGTLSPESKISLLSDNAALCNVLEPQRFPLSTWPGKGRHPLVLLQQCAVNIAANELPNGRILAVNGPPGTGKTTLLRDIVAHVVTERAKAMIKYDDPEKAFSNSGKRLKCGGSAFLHLYTLDPILHGFEIVVASSNNKAVENISVELPSKNAVDDSSLKNGYFSSISKSIWPLEDTWGIISAVLGNAKNRSAFRNAFWWDDNYGMQYYLRYCCGSPVQKEREDGTFFIPEVISKEKPPADHAEALIRWKKAKNAFIKALRNAQAKREHFQKISEYHQKRRADMERLRIVSAENETIRQQVEFQTAEFQKLRHESEEEKRRIDIMKSELDFHKSKSIGFFSKLFHTQHYQDWESTRNILNGAYKRALSGVEDLVRRGECTAGIIKNSTEKYNTLKAEITTLTETIANNDQQYVTQRGVNRGAFLDDDFFNADHAAKQTASPWLDEESSFIRGGVFEAAIELHRAFIDAAAKPIRHNLTVFLTNYCMKSFGNPEKDALIPDLWSTFFLVVPVVSTTFASFGAMFCNLGKSGIGWLLVDEAGQALPQAAVGALLRAQRAVVVGDPLQIEPIVSLPETLTERICDIFSIDPNIFNPPGASVQTLADRATLYAGSFETKQGTRDVGVPLLVHRRCSSPMFEISNSIAYENLMVQKKSRKDSAIRNAVGESYWVDIPSDINGKWNPAEGAAVLAILEKMRKKACVPDVYIITPFVDVQNALRDLIRTARQLDEWIPDRDSWVTERIGTVHTVQGREAESVILVLGAPGAFQVGGRTWAGKTPNILNVAVTRAKEALYVIGNREAWKTAGVFQNLDIRLKNSD